MYLKKGGGGDGKGKRGELGGRQRRKKGGVGKRKERVLETDRSFWEEGVSMNTHEMKTKEKTKAQHINPVAETPQKT